MKKCKKNLNVVSGLKGKEIDKIFLYQLKNNESIIYIGISIDMVATKLRHLHIINDYDCEILIIGEFYDRYLAEFFEIKLIEECLNSGVKLINKITSFTNE